MTAASAPAAERPRALAWRLEVLSLFVVALAVNGLASRLIAQPGYMDAYYYFGGSRQLAAGNGFNEPYLWNYLAPLKTAPGVWLWPSHLYWMPLASIVGAPFTAVAERLAGDTAANPLIFRITQVPFIVLAALIPLLAYAAARMISGLRRHALAAALLTLFSPFYFAYWTTTDVFVLYALTAAGAVLLVAQAERQAVHRHRLLFAAGLAAGLAHLARADGVLLLACLGLWLLVRRPLAPDWRGRLLAGGALLAGYLVVMLPWFVRNWVITGAPLGPGATRTLWLTDYNGLYSYALDRLSLAGYLQAGAATILSGKWSALQANLTTLFSVQGGIIAFPFGLVGLWQLRRQAAVQLALWYTAVLFIVMTLLFTFPGERGSYFHSGVMLVPFLMVAAVVGLDAVVDAAARVLRHWRPEQSKPIFTWLLVGGAVLLTLAVFVNRTVGADPRDPSWARTERVFGEAGDWLRSHGQGGALTMVNDPPGWYYWTGLPAIVIPDEDAATVHAVMQRFGARWLLVGVNLPVPLSQLYEAPQTQSAFQLQAQYVDENGKPAYLYEWVPGP